MSVTRSRLVAVLVALAGVLAVAGAPVPAAAAPVRAADADCSYPSPSPSPTASPSPSPSPSSSLVLLGGSPSASPSPTASPTMAPTSGCTGYDISKYQCSTPLPSVRAFGVVQVVGAPYGGTNPCLAKEWAWATASPEPADLYIFAGDTNASDSRWRGQTAPKPCSGTNGDVGCDYDYGYNAAKTAVFDVACDGELTADNTGGACLQPQTPVRWWVDVEGCSQGYWKQNACSSSATAAQKQAAQQGNVAAIQGYLDGLLAYPQRVSSVGLYGSPLGDWKVITGGDTTTFATVPYWYPDFSGDAQAMRAKWCGKTGPNGAPIAMVQGTPAPAPGTGSSEIDPDARCGPVVPGLAITSVLDKRPSGQAVIVGGTAAPGVTISLRLKRVTAALSTPLPAVTVDATGHWSTSFALPVNSVLAASDGSRTVTKALQSVAKVSAYRYQHKGRDPRRAASCLVLVSGNVAPWTAGQKVRVFGAFAKLLGTVTTGRAKVSGYGSWKTTVSVPCGKRTAVLPTVSGVAKVGRYAVDGRGKPFRITGS